MNKLGAVVIVIVMVAACYLIMLVVIPDVVVPLIESANETMTASSNMSDYPGSQSFLVSTPWILFFVPGTIGIIVITLILRSS